MSTRKSYEVAHSHADENVTSESVKSHDGHAAAYVVNLNPNELLLTPSCVINSGKDVNTIPSVVGTGDTDGDADGSGVGVEVGASDGTLVGMLDGLLVGAPDGLLVVGTGDVVGTGETVGALLTEGINEGTGVTEGIAVGTDVGIDVGIDVGTHVHGTSVDEHRTVVSTHSIVVESVPRSPAAAHTNQSANIICVFGDHVGTRGAARLEGS